MVDLEGLERKAMAGMPLPEGLSQSQQLLFLSFRMLYREYRSGVISKDDARKEKVFIQRRYALSQEREEGHFAACQAYQDSIRFAGTLRSDLNKGLRDGCPAEELLLLAVKIIKLMTGEERYSNAVPDRTSL